MTTTTPAAAPAAPALPRVYRASTRQNLVTMLLGWWLLVGLFVDGWAHNTYGESLETFFTPWHAVFYSGFLAVAAWCLLLARRGWQAGRRGLAAFPDGYGLAALGVPVFALGGLGDMLWHVTFGIEVGIEALLSPTHLLLFSGGVMLVGTPLNAAWRTPAGRQAPAAVRWTAVLSAASLLSVTAFMHMYMWGLLIVPQGLGWVQTRGELSAVLLTALILAGPVLLTLRRFDLPFGAVTLMYGLANLGMAVMLSPGDFRVPLLALLTGLLADVLAALLRPAPGRVWAWRLFAFLLPLAVWVPYLGGVVRLGLSNLSLELWLGVAVMSGLGGVALSVLLVPPAVPAGVDADT